MSTRTATFRQRFLAGEPLAGTFLKTPAYELVEVLSQAGLDFLCFDAEHAPFDRARLDACLAVARALDFPVLVRPGSATPENILQALDSGAVGIVAPHVTSGAEAAALAKAARYGHGGRGYAGSSRWAGFATRSMPELLQQSREETLVIAQIEDPEAVEAADEIAGTDGIDGLFLGPADLSVAWGYDHQTSDQLKEALASVGAAAAKHAKGYATFVANAEAAAKIAHHGFTLFCVASEQSWMRSAAMVDAKGIHALK